MRLPISRCGLVAVLAVCCLCGATGCKSGAWGWPSSNSNWLSWKNWGGSKPADTALASKPTTSAPKPSANATPQPTTSIAAGTGVSTPSTTATASTAYPTTSQGYASPYATQPASAYQQPGATNQVQPSGGYQTGPYNVNTTAAAGASAGYNQPAATTWNQDASAGYGAASAAPQNYSGQGYAAQGYAAQGYGAPTQPSSSGYATAAPSGDYRSADSRSMYGTQEASPYSNDAAQQNSYNAGSYGSGSANYNSGSYNQPAASGTSGGYSAPAASPATGTPAPTTNPWNSYQTPAPTTYGAASQPTSGATATTQPAASGYPNVPAALATSAGSYRPGSTAAAGEGVQNAAYTQPTATSPAASGSINYGNSYLR